MKAISNGWRDKLPQAMRQVEEAEVGSDGRSTPLESIRQVPEQVDDGARKPQKGMD